MLRKLNTLLHKIKSPSSLGIVVLAVVLIVLFYWFQWRPAEIRKECSKYTSANIKVGNGGNVDIDEFIKGNDFIYKECLRMRGL
jgi:hypothetical protein